MMSKKIYLNWKLRLYYDSSRVELRTNHTPIVIKAALGRLDLFSKFIIIDHVIFNTQVVKCINDGINHRWWTA